MHALPLGQGELPQRRRRRRGRSSLRPASHAHVHAWPPCQASHARLGPGTALLRPPGSQLPSPATALWPDRPQSAAGRAGLGRPAAARPGFAETPLRAPHRHARMLVRRYQRLVPRRHVARTASLHRLDGARPGCHAALAHPAHPARSCPLYLHGAAMRHAGGGRAYGRQRTACQRPAMLVAQPVAAQDPADGRATGPRES